MYTFYTIGKIVYVLRDIQISSRGRSQSIHACRKIDLDGSLTSKCTSDNEKTLFNNGRCCASTNNGSVIMANVVQVQIVVVLLSSISITFPASINNSLNSVRFIVYYFYHNCFIIILVLLIYYYTSSSYYYYYFFHYYNYIGHYYLLLFLKKYITYYENKYIIIIHV